MMKELINVIGLGYIGLPTALMMASKGMKVVGTDSKTEIVDSLNSNCLTFKEQGLEELYQKAIQEGIIFSNQYYEADYYIIAVPTPFNKTNKKIVVDYLVKAVNDVIDKCKKNSIIIIESTVSPGTIDTYIRPLIDGKNKKNNLSINIAHAPERIIPGRMVEELLHNDRTIGVDNEKSANRIKEIYSKFCEGELIVTDIKTAEMSKVVENAYRDINIAFANELVKICKEAKVDVYELIRIANKHPRVNILTPGPGVGGHCISVDPWFLVGDYPGLSNIILAARKINDSMPQYVINRIYEIMKEKEIDSLSKIAIYGLTYKENVDDVRESPTLQLIDCMERHLAAGVRVYDPYVQKKIVNNQYFTFEEFIKDIELLVIMVGHDEIKEKISEVENISIFDTRNIIEGENIYRL